MNRVERLQREISTLQRQVYKGIPRSPSAAKTRALSSGVAVDTRNVGRNSIRITQLENELRLLTGQIEQIDFRTQKIQTRLTKLIADMDDRLTALEAAAIASPLQTSVGVMEEKSQGNVGSLLRLPPAARANRGAKPGVLGTIPKNQASGNISGPTAAAPQSILPAGTPKEQYDYALSLMLKQQDFAKAEIALKAFIEKNPKNKLTGNAYYWLGETYYVRERYQNAAFSFAEGFQKFSETNKAPDSLLKLGMSLERMKQRKEACTAYSRLLVRFPEAAPRVKARVEREQRRAKCF
jgi:tol-pal system protein YbgF